VKLISLTLNEMQIHTCAFPLNLFFQQVLDYKWENRVGLLALLILKCKLRTKCNDIFKI